MHADALFRKFIPVVPAAKAVTPKQVGLATLTMLGVIHTHLSDPYQRAEFFNGEEGDEAKFFVDISTVPMDWVVEPAKKVFTK